MASKIIVSMTSFPAAIPFAVRAIQSILNGSVKPDKMILYLTASQFPNCEIQPELTILMGESSVFEIKFYNENIRSYTKLIPALKNFPDDIIVTVDDDVLYEKNMLLGLVRLHKKYPNAIIANRARHLKLGAPYHMWKRYKWHRFILKSLHPKFSNLQTGVSGVLYPPGCLKADMLDSKIFMETAPTADDLWFWAAAVANGTKIAPVPFGCWNPRDLKKPEVLCLKHVNIKSGVDVNRAVLDIILEKYPIIKQRVEDEK